MRHTIRALVVLLVSVAGSAGAATYNFDLTLDLQNDGRVYSTSTNEWWEGWFSVTPTMVSSGDRLIFSIGFSNNQGLTLSDVDGSNTELSKLTLGFSGSTFSENAFASSHDYTAFSGNLLSTSYSATTSGAGGDFVPLFHRNNLTDTSFTYWGLNFVVDLDVRSPVGTNSALLTQVEWSSSAQKVSIVDLPQGCGPSGGVPPKCGWQDWPKPPGKFIASSYEVPLFVNPLPASWFLVIGGLSMLGALRFLRRASPSA